MLAVKSDCSISERPPLIFIVYLRPNHIPPQDHPFIRSIETSLIPLLVYRNGILSNNLFQIHRLPFIPSFDYLYLYHIPLIPKTPHPPYLYPSLIFFVSYGVLISPNATPYPRFGPLLSQRPPKGKKGIPLEVED